MFWKQCNNKTHFSHCVLQWSPRITVAYHSLLCILNIAFTSLLYRLFRLCRLVQFDSPYLTRTINLQINHQTPRQTHQQTLIGHKYKPFVLPTSLSVDQFNGLAQCATNHQQTTVLHKYYLLDTNANDKQRYRLIELREQFGQLRSALTAIRASQAPLHSPVPHSPSKHASIKVNIDLLQFCLDLEHLLKLMQCSACKHPQLSLRSALYLQLKHAIFMNQPESEHLNDRILACVRRFEGEPFSNAFSLERDKESCYRNDSR